VGTAARTSHLSSCEPCAVTRPRMSSWAGAVAA